MTGDNSLPYLQTLDWRKILFGLFIAGIAIAYLMGWVPGLQNSGQFTLVVGMGLYWLGLNFFANGIFTDADRHHRLNRKIEELSQKIDDLSGISKKKMNNSIDEIFNDLKIKGLIEHERILKPDKSIENFKIRPFFSNTIYYDPELSGLSDNTIRFFLLHEEGHFVLKHSLLKNVIIFFGIIAFFSGLIWFASSLLIKTLYFDGYVCLLLIIVGIFFLLFSNKLPARSLELDEFDADVFAAEKLRDEFQIERPSITVKNAFNEMADFYNRINKNIKKNFLIKIWDALQEYHPIAQQRVANIIYRVDERNH